MEQSALTFPCAFPIKIMGEAEADFEGIVVSIIHQYVDDLGEGAITLKESKQGKYLSMTVTVQAKSQEQLDNIYRALSSHPKILMVI